MNIFIHVLNTTSKYEMVFHCINTFNCSVNRLVAKTHCFITIIMYCTVLNFGQCGRKVVTKCECLACFMQGMNIMVRTEI